LKKKKVWKKKCNGATHVKEQRHPIKNKLIYNIDWVKGGKR